MSSLIGSRWPKFSEQTNNVSFGHQTSQLMAGSNSSSFDFVLFRRFWHLSKILFPGICSVTSLLLFFLLTLALLEQYIIYNVGLIASGYYKVLGNRDLQGFWSHTFISLGIISAVAVVKGTRQFTTSTLYLAWRQVLCHGIHRLYFSDILYYKLNVLETTIDNPDQRITQDVEKMCNGLSDIFPSIIVAPFTIAYYSYQTYNTTGIAGPLAVLGFFLVSTVVNKILMSPIVRLVVQQERKEGNFRFKHMQVRVNAESLAFCGTSNAEYLRANQKLNDLIVTQKSIVNWKYGLQMAINFFDYMGSLVSYFLLAYPIFTGKYDNLSAADLGALISKNAFVTIYLISCFSSLVDLSVKVTDIAGSTHRIAQLLETLVLLKSKRSTEQRLDLKPRNSINSVPTDKAADDHDKVVLVCDSVHKLAENHKDTVVVYNRGDESIGDHDNRVLAFKLENVTVQPPNSLNVLVKGLTIDFPLGTNVLIMGHSSSGKTSLIRLLRGLWQPQTGSVQQLLQGGLSDCFFLPAQPFLTDGTLREQIIYPLKENDADFESLLAEDVDILNFLGIVGMSSIVERTGGLDEPVHWNWEDVLSPGETQRLGFARLFYHQPRVAVLDEATSAISLDVEDQLYRECIRRGITLISVGHRETLKSYHSSLLYLDGAGGWTLTQLEQVEEQNATSA